MLEPAGNLGLGHESPSSRRVAGAAVLQLLEGHLAIQLAIKSYKNLAQAPLGVAPHDLEPLAALRDRSGGFVNERLAPMRRRCVRAGRSHRIREFGFAELIEPRTGRRGIDQAGHALLEIAAVPGHILAGKRLDQRALSFGQGTMGNQMLGQGSAALASERPKGVRDDRRRNQIVMESDQAEKHVGRGIAESIHGLSVCRYRRAYRGWVVPRAPSRNSRSVESLDLLADEFHHAALGIEYRRPADPEPRCRVIT
jgi:hypothetical protein